jgi:hypothetical protein
MRGRLLELLKRERHDEGSVVEAARNDTREELPGEGWPAVTYLGHFAHWRGILARHAVALRAGEPAGSAPEDTEAENQGHLARDRETSTEELIREWEGSWGEMLGVVEASSQEELNVEPNWFGVPTVSIAILRNSYTHPRDHLVDFWIDRGQREKAAALCEDLSGVTGEFAAFHPRFPGAHLFYGGLSHALRGEAQPAVLAFKQAVVGRPDIAASLREDERLAFVRELAGFGEIG